MPDHDPADRLYHNARREAVLVLIIWALALTWTVGYCYLHGYRHAADSWVVRAGLAEPEVDAALVAGMPAWVFHGIVVPWLVCLGLTFLFGQYMADDDLGAEAEGEEAGHAGH
jgi:hypothetical protein